MTKFAKKYSNIILERKVQYDILIHFVQIMIFRLLY